MTINELKTIVEKNLYRNEFMVWKLEDDNSVIIANQYLNKISKDNNYQIKYIDDIKIIKPSFIIDDNLYILKTDEFEFTKKIDRLIVICNKTKYDKAVEIPKLVDWQVRDLILTNFSLNEKNVDWLIQQYSGNYLALLNELDKIKIFSKDNQQKVLEELNQDGEFDKLVNLKIWDLSNGIIKKDLKSVCEVLKYIDDIDIEPIGLATILYNNFKNILSIQLNSRCTASDLGLSDKQLYVIKKYNCGYYSSDQLKRIFEFITSIEYMFKFGGLYMKDLINYMICGIVGCCYE